jgi:hypothetical protein
MRTIHGMFGLDSALGTMWLCTAGRHSSAVTDFYHTPNEMAGLQTLAWQPLNVASLDEPSLHMVSSPPSLDTGSLVVNPLAERASRTFQES